MYFLLVSITIISSIISLFYATMALRSKGKDDTAYYAFVRSIAIFILIVLAVIINDRNLLLGCSLLMVLVQLGDAIVGLRISDKLKTYGPLSVAIISLALLLINMSR